MVIGNDSLDVVQGFTRNKQDLLFALDHLPAVLPVQDHERLFLLGAP